jgi:hypothetical protein
MIRLIILIAASWPSKRLAAVTIRTRGRTFAGVFSIIDGTKGKFSKKLMLVRLITHRNAAG